MTENKDLLDSFYLEKLKLTFIESAVLKTYIIGYSEIETLKFLEITKKDYEKIINKIYLKYQSDNLFEIIHICLIKNHLDRYDLVKPEVKKMALKYSKSIFDNLNILSFIQKNTVYLKKELNNFEIDTNKLFIENASHKDLSPLTKEEVVYIKQQINNFTNTTEQNSETLKQIKNRITNKFQANNYFNAIRRAIELDLINKLFINFEYVAFFNNLQIATINKIESMIIVNKYSDKEKQLCLYFELVNYYNNIEDNLLFNNYSFKYIS
ncbi:MAG: hypothetical protein K9I95_11370 [Flavobacteriaceae bacterium]|nr:hypothetical protein [Flavobacteriaceae bacterium]